MSKKEKKTKKRGRRIPLKENPLYPPKQESSLKGALISIVIVIVIIVLDVMLMEAINSAAYGDIMMMDGGTVAVYEECIM